jgi:hypothetical protein
VRKIVYLDHSVLSTLARGENGAVLAELTANAQAGTAVFPFSWTHHYEAELDSRMENAIHTIGARLSRGLWLRSDAEIASAQARRSYLRFIGQEDGRPGWADAYEHDPQADLPLGPDDIARGNPVPTDPAGRDERRCRKNLFAQSLTEQRAARSASFSFVSAKRCYAEEAARFYFAVPLVRALRGETTGLASVALQFAAGVIDEAFGIRAPLRTPAEVEAGVHSALEFFTSHHPLEIPFINLEASILASLEADEASRPYGRGDLHDVETWSAYLPYVDLAVADSQMSAVLNRRGLAGRYGCVVFPHTAAGVAELMAELKKLGRA